ncbi:ABC1 family-domain-containing protein [Zygosaccharomyces rouxii]|nr:ABC1 family-domain-containing protein [Zygosaccharomyces rouxii]
MSTRRTLYHIYCLGSSARSVLSGSWDIGKESLGSWINTSTLTRPILNEYQWFYDPKWEEAKKLAEDTRNLHSGKPHLKKSRKKVGPTTKGTREYSTSTKVPPEEESRLLQQQESQRPQRELQSSEVPSSRLARLFHYGSLAAGVGIHAATEGITEVAKGRTPTWKQLILSDSNVERITKTFSQMRGAALKVGQILSFQDDKVLPRDLYEILSRVQNSAHYMPQRQLDKVLKAEFGDNWKSNFAKFDRIPIAAASIGQVHNAVLPNGDKVVVKIQYPGVKDSIDSDLNNIMMVLGASRLLPKGLFLDKTIDNARKELKWECDYVREAQCLQQFEKLLEDDPVFEVPHVYPDLTTSNVITMSRMEGIEIMKLAPSTPQHLKDYIAGNIMKLCLQEIAVFHYLGYLNGLESQAMVDAHVRSVITLGEPFSGPIDKPFSFRDQTVSDRIRANIGLMLDERLCPPPEETYSLHRKFSGIFLLCARMGATIPCSKYFHDFFHLE